MSFRLKMDTRPLLDAVQRANKQALGKAGALIRGIQRGSMRRAKGAAPPGAPPNVHEGTLKNLIRFAVGDDAKTVVIGPELAGSGGAAKLEFGGTETIKTKHGRRQMTTKPHPFAGPSLTQAIDSGEIPKAWSGSVRGGR